MHTKIKSLVDRAKVALASHDVYKATELVYKARCEKEQNGADYSDFFELLKVENEIINIWINDLKISELFPNYKPQRSMW